METKYFQTETKRLLDLMINSIYTHKEIFLRELISNASDAIDKLHYLSLTNDKIKTSNDYQIMISINQEERTLTITDNGIGMTYEELVSNLGTIAKSGSKEFLEKIEKENAPKNELDIIGQFGVGFYSAFMVASKVVVKTHSALADKGYTFISEGEETYQIEENNDDEIGTSITLHLREQQEEVNFNQFLEQDTIEELVKKYSDYIRYPIVMWVTEEEPILDEEGKETEEVRDVKELKTLNSMIPIWKKNKSEVTDDEFNTFYKQKYGDYTDPITNIFVNVEGAVTYNALIFIPSHAPYDLYSDKFEKGIQLYTKGVFILDKCKELVPDYLRFIRGLVDSADLSLNISREMLQHDRGLVKIAQNLEKKILAEFARLQKNEREKYDEFYKTFGVNLKYGVYEDYGAKKEQLKDLIMFKTINEEKYITLAEYLEKAKEGQEFIYYAVGKTKDFILSLPQMDMIKKAGYDVLILSDEVDEFMINILSTYNEKAFKSITQGDLNLLDEEELKKVDELIEEKKDLLTSLKEALKDDVKDVVLSKRLTESPVCLVSGEGLSMEMEKVLKQMPNNPNLKAERILEINPNHPILKALDSIYQKDMEEGNKYAKLLYSQALLIEGISLENPLEFSKLMCELMIKNTN